MSYSAASIPAGAAEAGLAEAGLAVTGRPIEKIKAMITSGALRAGGRLPREPDLAAELGLSRSWLRAAVRALSRVNSVLAALLESVSGPATRARIWRGLTQPWARGQTPAEHRAILATLAAHEPEVARAWAIVHIADVEQWPAVP